MKILRIIAVFWLVGLFSAGQAQPSPVKKSDFDVLNLDYPGLDRVKSRVQAGQYDQAATALLEYFKNRSNNPDFSASEEDVAVGEPLAKSTIATADSALLHKFQPHKGYGFFFYGKDINWKYWPVKDNEVRWQLHRVKWWQSMALVYAATKDQRYAREWMYQFTDWAKKNALGLSKDNDRFAWRPLEVSDRILNLAPTFNIFVQAPCFTPAFLMKFLNNYHQQADYLSGHYAERGNHRLFEAQRVMFAGVSFPEFKRADSWRSSGVAILNDEIKKQVYPDGMQWELSPNYHVAMINTFLSALHSAQQTGMDSLFPESYKSTVKKMIMALISISFPDYTYPMFSDSKLVDKRSMLKSFKKWAKAFADDPVIRYFATDRQQGTPPSFLSKGLTTAGFYTLRNGWKDTATVMVLKASPPGAFHAQPDNGTFDLWVKGRNFTPDAGCYVYAGDAEIMKLRNWYRQTRVHSTLTLNNENMVITKANLKRWQVSSNLDALTYINPSYPDLNHQRTVLFIDQQYFLIIDEAIGNKTGTVGVHFQLNESNEPVFDEKNNRVYTTYTDGNNLLIQNLNQTGVALNREEGKVSYAYRKEVKRPAFVFEKKKNQKEFPPLVSIAYPFTSEAPPTIRVIEHEGNNYTTGNLNLTIFINDVPHKIVEKSF